ncbi:lipoprotein [Flaviramulus aquimarinus]|uniref:Lipoprotein n=1 Tax=Flaviramulus aquimarinus TaxID=1170456 RepID=A0ABP9EZM6_9FLAO
MSTCLKKHILALTIVFFIFNCSKNDDNNGGTSNAVTIDFVKTLGGTKNETGQAIVKTSDGGYAILGHTQSMDGDITDKSNESFNYWLLKFDQNDTLEWQKNYGGSDDDRGRDIIQTSDNGYAIIGYSKSNDDDVTNNNGAHDFWVSKLDPSGNILWEKNYGFSGADIGNSIIQTKDGGFLLTGVLDVSASNGAGNSKSVKSKFSRKHAGGDYWTVKINALGEKQWSRYFGGTFTDTPYDAIQTDDNGYLLVGSSDSEDVDIKNSKGAYDFWIVKISETGTLIWEKSFGGSQTDEARAIIKSDDGNYIIVGNTRSDDLDVTNNKGAADLWTIKISPAGEFIWEKSFGGSSFDVAQSISKTQDGGFIISGNSRSADGNLTDNKGQNDAWVIKIDTNGNLKWQKTVGGSDIDFAYDVVEINNKDIIVVGDSSSSNLDVSNNNGFTDLLIFKIKQ